LDTKEQLTVAEAGRRGGRATLENQGVDFFRRIGAKGGKRTKELYADLLKEFGKRGGRPRRPMLGQNLGEDLAEEKGGRGRPTRSSPVQL